MESSHKNYVLGLAFSENGKDILLIQKTKPEWQAGKLNGIGGKVEPYEGFNCAMVREFLEETELYTTVAQWDYIGKLKGRDWNGGTFTVYVYTLFHDDICFFKSPTEEQVRLIPVESLERYPHIPNLDWLVPMALNHHAEKTQSIHLKEFTVEYE